MKSLRRILSFVTPYRRDAILALILLAAVVVAELSLPRLTQRIIDDGIHAGNTSVIIRTMLIMLGASVVSAAFAIVNTILSVRAAQNTTADIRSAVVRKVQTFSFGNLDRLQTGELIVRSTSDISMVQMIVTMGLRILTRAPLLMIGSIILLVVTSPRLALLMAVLMPLVLALVSLFATRARPMFEMVQKKLDKLNGVLQENLAGVRVVKAFVRADHENERFGVINDDFTQQNIRVLQFMSVLIPSLMFVLNLGVVGAIWFGGVRAIEGPMTVGQIVAFINYLNYAMFPMLMLAGMIGPISAADASASRIYEILDAVPEVQENVRPRPDRQDEPSGKGRIAFEHVCFSYNGDGAEPVLHDINLVAEAGEQIAVLGATGSGKSTLVHLIPRFYDVNDGRVTLDGIDVRELPLNELRARVGMSLQEAVLFSGSIRDNIRYGRPDASDADVIAAAKAAQAHDFIMNLPDGYDNLVGQRGTNLSGGQKQRLAIARALLVRPDVLILDDSTSAVDVETEAKIQEALDVLMAGRTTFIIAQRISTVLNADKIVVLDRGQVAALGAHAELIVSAPIYQEIYQSQLGTNGNHKAAGTSTAKELEGAPKKASAQPS